VKLEWERYQPGDAAEGAASWAANGRVWSYLVYAGASGVTLTRWRASTPSGDARLHEALANAFPVRPPRGLYDASPGLVDRGRSLAELWEDGKTEDPRLGGVILHPAWGPEAER
jgi:hypothetical protein